MPRIDRGYITPSREFNNKGPKKFRDAYLDEWTRGKQILGGLQPIVEMERDIANIFRPYKSWGKVLKDLAQPFRGIGNGISGLVQIIYSPFFLLFQLTIGNIMSARTAFKGEIRKEIGSNTTRALAMSFSWALSGISQIIRGVTQLAATPLAWIKMIARGFSTLENRGFQRLVDDRNIRRLVKQADELATDLEINPAQKIASTSPLLESERSNDERVKKLSALKNELATKYHNAEFELRESKSPRLPNIKPTDFKGDWLNFFKTAIAERKDELADIKAERKAKFGRGAAAA
jgi:hypothetical protein